jgi:hypothetical protein
MKYPLLLLVASVSLFAIACSKDDDDNTPEEPEVPVQIQMITSGTWKIDSMGFDVTGDGVMEEPLDLKTCQADNTLRFLADSTGTFSEGAEKCSSEDADATPITWHFKNEYKIVAMDGLNTALDGDVSVLALTDTSLILSAPVTSPVAGSLIVSLGK